MSDWPRATLHLDAGREFRGGQRQVLYLTRELLRRGHRLALCCPRGSTLFTRAEASGIPVIPLTLRSGIDFPSAVRLARLVRCGEFDVVHAHDARSHGIARIAQGVSHHPALAENLFVTRRSIGETGGRLDRLKYAAPGASYIAISHPVRDALHRLGVDLGRIALVPSGVECERLASARLAPEDPWGLRGSGRWVIGTVGALSREKNQALLLEAFARVRSRVPTAHLLVVGEGTLRRGLERRAQAADLAGSVTFAGRVEDVAPAYATLDVFVLSSDVEGLGTAVLDAMSAGVPVVTTAAAGVLEIARHGESALVVPPRDAEALAGALLRLREQPELAARLVSGARRVAAAHDVAAMVDGTLRAYARLGRPTREAAAARLEATAPSRESER